MLDEMPENKKYNDPQQTYTPQLFFKEDYLTIAYDEAHQWLYANWMGYQTEGTVMQGCEKMLEALKKFSLSKVLNDNTYVLGIWTPAAQWVGSNWFPRMQAAGLKYFAWIYSPSRLSQVSTDESINNAPLPQLIKTFYDLEEGKAWLKSNFQ